MNHQTSDARKYKVLSCRDSADFEELLNTSEDGKWKLHSWNFCDNSYSVTYVALMVRDISSDSAGEA